MSTSGKFAVFTRLEYTTEWRDSGVRGDTEESARKAWDERVPVKQRGPWLHVEVREAPPSSAARPLPDPDDVNPAHRATVARWKAGDFAPDKLREQAERDRLARALDALRLAATYYDATPPQAESAEKHRDRVRTSLLLDPAAVVEALLEVIRDGSVALTKERLRQASGVGASPPEPRIPDPAAPAPTPRQAESGLVADETISGPLCQPAPSARVADSWHLPPGDAAAGRHVVAIEDGPPAAAVIPPLDGAPRSVVEWMTINPDAEPVPPGCPVALLGDRLGFRNIDGALHVVDGRTAVKLGETRRARFLRELAGDGVYLTGPEAAAYRAFQAASAALEDSHRAFRERQREHLEATAVLGRATTKGNDQSDGGAS